MQQTDNQEFLLRSIEEITKMLAVHINYNTIAFLNRIGYNPLPDFVLPSSPKYDRSIIRTPYDQKYNILSEFDNEGFPKKMGAGCEFCGGISAGCEFCGGWHIP